jgi:hypothetical protein
MEEMFAQQREMRARQQERMARQQAACEVRFTVFDSYFEVNSCS